MSEPSEIAQTIEEPIPGIRCWSVQDDRLGGVRSNAYALPSPDGTVLVDPLPVSGNVLPKLEPIAAVVLTIQSHQRSAWRLRRERGARVWAPRGAEGLEEEPDVWYGAGDELPGGLRAVHAPGPCDASYALALSRDRPPKQLLFVGDVVIAGEGGALEFVEDTYMDEPQQARDSVRRLSAEIVDVVLPGHGSPVVRGGTRAMREALARDGS